MVCKCRLIPVGGIRRVCGHTILISVLLCGWASADKQWMVVS